MQTQILPITKRKGITEVMVKNGCMHACMCSLQVNDSSADRFCLIVVVTVAGLYSQLGKVVGTPVAEQ